MQKIYLKWVDSRMYHGWKDESDLQHIMEMPLEIETIGWMIHENDQRIVVSGNWSPHSENFGNPIVIPKCSILKRKKVK